MEDTIQPQFPRSPVPVKNEEVPAPLKKPVEMDFCEALKQTLDGKKITRIAWDTNTIFGQMLNDRLNIFINGEFHSWTLVSGDIVATDWVVLPEQTKE